MNEKYLSQRISRLRTIKGVSARDMSLSIGQNENYINHIENGKTMPSIQGFFYICEYFGISPKEFFDEEREDPVLIKDIMNGLNELSREQILVIYEIIKGFKK